MFCRQQFINFLIEECERNGVEKSEKLYHEIILFVESNKGHEAYIKFSKLNIKQRKPRHINDILKDTALFKKRRSNTVEHP